MKTYLVVQHTSSVKSGIQKNERMYADNKVSVAGYGRWLKRRNRNGMSFAKATKLKSHLDSIHKKAQRMGWTTSVQFITIEEVKG